MIDVNKQEEGLKLIKTCLEAQAVEDDHTTTVAINIRSRDRTLSLKSYEINIDSVNVLEYRSDRYESEGGWDGNGETFAIFGFDKGFGLATESSWWDATFSGTDYVFDVYESKDWVEFDNLCLTDDIRDKIHDLIAEMVLLREITAQSSFT